MIFVYFLPINTCKN